MNSSTSCPRRHRAAAPNDLRRAVFLDRDGVLVDDPGYLSSVEQVRLLPGVAPALARLRDAGWRLVVVTNQSGVARGYFTEDRLAEIHARLLALLAAEEVALDAIYYCPHHVQAAVPDYRADCPCRKPRPGLLETAARDLGLDLSQCWMVGDQPADVSAGRAAGCRTILVSDDPTAAPLQDCKPTACAACLAGAASVILDSGGK